MKKLLLIPALIICLGFASCKKEELPKPELPASTFPTPKNKLRM